MEEIQRHLDFSGVKIAIICGSKILTYLRDDKPDIPFPNCWDLAGGGREGDESPEECAVRETEEEFAIRLSEKDFIWKRCYAKAAGSGQDAYFFAVLIAEQSIQQIRFGDEGQHWLMMEIKEFLDHPRAVPQLKLRLSDFLSISANS